MIGALAVLGEEMPDRQNVVPKVVGSGYGPVAKSLYWLVVALLLVQFAIAWTMPGIHRGTRPDGLIGLHLSFGMTILAVAGSQLAVHPDCPAGIC